MMGKEVVTAEGKMTTKVESTTFAFGNGLDATFTFFVGHNLELHPILHLSHELVTNSSEFIACDVGCQAVLDRTILDGRAGSRSESLLGAYAGWVNA